MATYPLEEVVSNVEVRLRRLVATTVRLCVVVPVAIGVYWGMHQASGDVDVVLEMPAASRFALLAVIVAVAVTCFSLARTVLPATGESGAEDATTMLIAVILPPMGVGSAVVAAMVGWSAVLESAPDRVEVSGVIWFVVSVGIAMLSLATTVMVPESVTTELAADRRRRRALWVERARKAWGDDRIPKRRHVVDIVLMLSMPALGIAATAVITPLLVGDVVVWVVTAGFLSLVLVIAFAVLYVTRQWWLCAIAGPFTLLGLLEIVEVLLILFAADGAPRVTGALWSVICIGSLGWIIASFSGGVLRVLMRVALARTQAAIEEADDPACPCESDSPRWFVRFRRRHAELTGRSWPPSTRCPEHRDHRVETDVSPAAA